MRKFLSIIIPRYKETEKDIFPLLSSINNQVGIDFDDIEVIIANDGGGPGELDQSFMQLFNMDIRQINLDTNRGPGVARQTGLDIAKGEYVMFCDADDIIHNVGVIGAFIHECESQSPDILSSSWLEEMLMEDGKYTYINHNIENTWMHGKVIRRHFLVQNNVRFHEELRVHEDSYFLAIAASCTNRRNHLPTTTYVWKYQPDSITRRNGASYTYDSIPTFIEACCMAYDEIEKRNPSQMEYNILQFTLYNYFCFHQPGWQMEEHAEYLKAAETAFAKCIKRFWKYWENASPETISKVYNEERNKSFAGGVETETLREWINRLQLG